MNEGRPIDQENPTAPKLWKLTLGASPLHLDENFGGAPDIRRTDLPDEVFFPDSLQTGFRGDIRAQKVPAKGGFMSFLKTADELLARFEDPVSNLLFILSIALRQPQD